MHRRYTVTLLLAGLVLTGCGSGTSDNYTESDAPGGYVLFSSDTGNIPYPNDILYDPQNGHLALPVSPDESAGSQYLKAQLNTLDGFSTTSPLSVGVSEAVDASTLAEKVLLIDTTSGALAYGTDFVAGYDKGKILLLPLHPLKPQTRYIAVLLKGIQSARGKALEPDYATSLILGSDPLVDAEGNPTVVLSKDPAENAQKAQKLEAIRQHTQSLITAAGLPADAILDIWSFKTQSIGNVARAFADDNPDDSSLLLKNTGITAEYALGLAAAPAEGNVSVYAGLLTNLPYYLAPADGAHDTAPLQASFSFEGSDLPVKRADLNVPVLAVAPSASSACKRPDSGWPVVIFQHGITQNRTNLLAIAQSLEKICRAGVAIDLPLHGVTDPANPFYVEYNATTKTGERTFDLDLHAYDDKGDLTGPSPDGKPDPSGQYYINLASILTSRDNIRQSTSDLIALKNALARASGLTLDAGRVAYVGHSLGAMAPFAFFAHADLESVVLANPGGGIAQLLSHSEAFGPVIRGGLQAAGIEPDSADYDAFMLSTQTLLDDADPLNYAAAAAANQKILAFETIPDTVIPNNADSPLLYGTEPLLRLMGATNMGDYPLEAGTPVALSTPVTATRLTAGTHSSFLRPDVPEATVEMQTEATAFVANGGMGTLIVHPDIIRK